MNHSTIDIKSMCATCGLAMLMQAQGVTAQGVSVIEEITVTAQRREQNLQDVPISVSVLSEETTKSFDVITTQDLQKAVPGLVFVHRNLSSLPSIRGIGSENTAGGDESGVSLYVDGVYRASANSGTFSLPGIERIEVLKGPQGTLFGRNATGGVINIVSKQPSMDPAATVSAGYANYDTVTTSAYLTGPITDNIAANVSARYQERNDGWGENVGTGNDVYTVDAKAISTAFRLNLDNTIITLRGDWSRDVWHGGPGQTTATLPGQGNSTDGMVYYAGRYNVNSDIDTVLRLENYGGSLTIDHEFRDLQFRSISAYRGTDSFLYGESDSIPFHIFHFTTAIEDSIFTQEFHLMSGADSKLDWIIGGFYLHSEPDIGPTEQLLPGFQVDGYNELETTSYAIFGQATYPLSDKLNITVGARYTIDEKNYTNIGNAVPGTQGVVTVLPEETYESPTWRLALDYALSDNILAYASYNRGFKSGVFGTGATAPAVEPAYVDAYEAGLKTELLNRRLTLNLAVFYSKYDDLQLSQTVILQGGGLSSSFIQLQNAAKAESKGIDADLIFRPTDELTLRASVSLLNSEFKEFENAPGFEFAPNNRGLQRTVFDASGDKMNGAPSLAYTLSGRYVKQSEMGEIGFEVNDSYTSKYWFSVDQLQESQARHLVGASIDWTSLDESWNVRLWGSNLLDEYYFDTVVARGFQLVATTGAPRTYGITATFNF